jgi:cytochrome c oxidase cbb3-type subunit 3
LGWSSIGQLKIEEAKADATVKPMYDKYMGMDVKALAADKQAMETGKRLYLTYCMQCHGADGRGAKGFPNLTDSDWLYGGEPELIKQTIADGRMGVMPPHAQLGADTIKDLANYVRSLSGLPNDSVRAAKGKEAFTSAGCVGCHGPDAKGMAAIGAPNLTDKTWLYGSSEATITETIINGRQNKMPAWKDFLGDGKIQLLTAYVYSLNQGAK